jgi:predicted nucleic acid-binding protein
MTDLTVDTSVWIGAADPGDVFHHESASFLAAAELNDARIVIPAFARVEVACALARKLGGATIGRRLADVVMGLTIVAYVPVDADLLEVAWRRGTDFRLRGADAIYAATAHLFGAQLITWDKELIQRVGAITPTAWLDADP